jgi:sec-independent protein translocase protein TatA
MPNIRGPELLILVLVIVLLFGAKRLPDAARSVGRSLRIFKAETKGLVEGETAPESAPSGTASSTGTASAAAESPTAPAALPPAQPPAAPAPTAVPPADPVAADNALAPQADVPASALQPQPPTQA